MKIVAALPPFDPTPPVRPPPKPEACIQAECDAGHVYGAEGPE